MSELQVWAMAGQSFSQVFYPGELPWIWQEFSSASEYETLHRYYKASSDSQLWSEQLAPALLFKDAFDSLVANRKGPASAKLSDISARLDNYVNRLKNTVQMFSPVLPEVPKIMHFVWVGGSEFGGNQRDYLNIWKQVLSNDGNTLNLWYDPDALMAFDTNRIITQAAKAHAMESGGAEMTRLKDLSELVERRVEVLRRQMFEHVKAVQQRGGKADDARIDLLVNAYGQDRATLEAARARYLESHLAMAGEHVRVCDARATFSSHFLWDVYEREVSFRGNLAAASDVVRLQAQSLGGGTYSDLDYLPPLVEVMGGVDISKYSFNQKLGVLQLLLNGNPALMPHRDKNQYKSQVEAVPVKDREALVKFSASNPGVLDIFAATKVLTAPQDGVRLGTALGNKEMNAFITAHPDSGMVHSIMKRIRSNYDLLLSVEQKIINTGAHWESGLAGQSAQQLLQQESELTHRPLDYLNPFIPKLYTAIGNYHRDGIYPQADGTILLTGPGAAIWGMEDFVQTHCIQEAMAALKGQLKLDTGYNRATEEETISGWVDNVTELETWVLKEQQNWREGKYKTRYTGNLPELLKQPTMAFKQGWPVIEGRPVLRTGLLQRWMDELGEPFIRAMNEKLSGELNFDRPWSVDFDDRQQVLAQPLTELPVSHGFDPIGNLNEMIVRIGHGSLPLDQLSPMHRTLLGGLFGAHTLDNVGFDAAWQQVRTLAENTADRGFSQRFMAIEQVLLTQKHPEFVAGFDAAQGAFQPAKESAQLLKALAFEKPMSLRQWGERVVRIRHQVEYELRKYILERSGAVLETFIESGATTGKLMPQGLLVRGEGDPGRRCYPLALLMAAAIHQGDASVEALRGRLANANLSPGENDSHAFLRALDDLRSIPQADFGNKLGALNFDGVLGALAAKSSPCTLMLNTENHSMLVARIGTPEQGRYFFYDPNFGVFEFDRIESLERGMKRLFSVPELARQYAIEASVNSSFNVIELDGTRIASKRLPSKLNVLAFLGNESLSAGKTVVPWQHHAALRARALSENARLGRALSERDASVWAKEIDLVTARVRAANQLGAEFVPLFSTVQAQADDSTALSFMDIKTSQVHEVTSKEPLLKQIKAFLDNTIKHLAGKNDRPVSPVDPTDVSEGSRLSFAFGFQTLITELRNRDHGAEPGMESNLAVAVRLHGYLGYAQLTHGIVLDTLQMASLVRQLVSVERAIAVKAVSTGGQLLTRVAGPGLGQALGVVNIGFDLYEFLNAENHEQSARFGTQLVFDVAALALDGVALVAGGTAGAVAGALSVPLLGIGIGVTAIAGNLGQIMDKAEKVAELFTRFKMAYSPEAFSSNEGFVSVMPEAVVDTLDLREGVIVFDSQGLFRSMGGSGLPRPDGNKENAIVIRESMGLPKQVAIPGPRVHGRFNAVPTGSALLLPGTPKCYYGYEYQLGSDPEAFEWEDLIRYSSLVGYASIGTKKKYPQYEVLRDLETKEEGFYFTHARPFRHILYKLNPVYEPTTINVRVGNETRALYVPELPREISGKVSYRIDTVGGPYALSLRPGVVAVTLSARPDKEALSWVLIADWTEPQQVSVESFGLSIDGIHVNIAVGTEVFVQTRRAEMYRVVWSTRQLSLATLKAKKGNYSRTERERLKKLYQEQRLDGAIVPLGEFQLPFGNPQNPQRTAGWYEVAKERFIYGRQFLGPVSEKLQLAAVQGDHAYFYHPDYPLIWRVNAITGLTTWCYRVLNPSRQFAVIASCLDLGAGVIQVTQTVRLTPTQRYVVVYLIQGQEIVLVSVTTEPPDYFDSLEGVLSLFKQVDSPVVADSGSAERWASWKPARFVTAMSGEIDKPSLPRWIFSEGNQVMQPRLPSGEISAQALQLTLLPMGDADAQAFLFYDAHSQFIYQQQLTASPETTARHVPLPGKVTLSGREGRYQAINDYGLIFDLRADASFFLWGVTGRWLNSHPDWLNELQVLGKEFAVSVIALSGLSNVTGRMPLFALYVEHRLLIVDPDHEGDYRLLGTSRDGKYAWLHGMKTGHLYRQPFMTDEQLRIAFGGGTRLLHREALLRPEKQWAQWSFSDVLPYDGGLRGRTRDGLNIDMVEAGAARIIGVEHVWSYRSGESIEALTARLKDLVSRHAHVPYLPIGNAGSRFRYYVPQLNRVFSISGRSDGQWSNFLGTKNETIPVLFDPVDGLIFNRDTHGVLWVKASKATRDGDVMTLEIPGEVNDLLAVVPDGVSTLVLGCAETGSTYRVSEAAWQHLDCIVVDCSDVQGSETQAPGHLILETVVRDGWRVDRVERHLLFTDPDNGRSVIFRNAHGSRSALRRLPSLSLQVLGGTLEVTVDELLEVTANHGESSLELRAVVERLNEV
ncbi:TcdA/TcdB pore-forming domain-containing protein [Pseudomonas sp. LB3P25]